jgi:acetyl-CoA carboxylase biotin carboxyl carrier protein
VEHAVLLARIEPGEGGVVRVLSPAVGTWSGHPAAGALVGPGSAVGRLQRLQARHVLLLPEGAAGCVRGTLRRDRSIAVEFGEILFELAPVGAVATDVAANAERLGHPAGEALPAGTWAVVAPTDGTFYRSPSPGTPPFVHEGARVRDGQAVGIVEVMKTFNRVVYGGPGLPSEAEVVEMRCGDAVEVRAGQILLVVR